MRAKAFSSETVAPWNVFEFPFESFTESRRLGFYLCNAPIDDKIFSCAV